MHYDSVLPKPLCVTPLLCNHWYTPPHVPSIPGYLFVHFLSSLPFSHEPPFQTITLHESSGHIFSCLTHVTFAYIPPGSHCHRLSGYDIESSLSHGIYSNAAMNPSPTTSLLAPHERAVPTTRVAHIPTYYCTCIFCESMQIH